MKSFFLFVLSKLVYRGKSSFQFFIDMKVKILLVFGRNFEILITVFTAKLRAAAAVNSDY